MHIIQNIQTRDKKACSIFAFICCRSASLSSVLMGVSPNRISLPGARTATRIVVDSNARISLDSKLATTTDQSATLAEMIVWKPLVLIPDLPHPPQTVVGAKYPASRSAWPTGQPSNHLQGADPFSCQQAYGAQFCEQRLLRRHST